MATANNAPSSTSASVDEGPKKTLTTTGVTINAMALIAPGAFLWLTFQLQAAQVGPDGKTSTALDMWQGIAFALFVAFLTAIAYSEMAKVYPDAGYGSAYYFAEKTFLDKEEATKYHKWARISKLVTGWAAHLFYWVYPGVMVAFFATLVSYIAGLFGVGGGDGLPLIGRMIVAILFAVICGAIAIRGINGSTMTNLIINIVQLLALVGFGVLALMYRSSHPTDHYAHLTPSSIVMPHSVPNVLFQASLAILILVGFESCTALGAEAKDARKSVPIGVLLSLGIQGIFAYGFGYFCANYAVSDKLVNGTGTAAKTGMDAAAASSAPIGDMMRLFGDSLFQSKIGFALTVTMAATVVLAVLGTTLACTNTAVRVSYAMSKDEEMPEILGLMHGKFATPAAATWILTVVSAIIGCVGCYNASVGLTGITLASNLGTFILYALICVWTLMAFSHRKSNFLLHKLIPFLGLVTNLLMVATIFYLTFASGGDTAKAGYLAFGIAALWGIVSVVYVVVNNARHGRRLIAHPTKPVQSAQSASS